MLWMGTRRGSPGIINSSSGPYINEPPHLVTLSQTSPSPHLLFTQSPPHNRTCYTTLMTGADEFIELEDYWLSITRRDHSVRGLGKWMLHTEKPHHLYKILKKEFINVGFKDAISIKTKAELPPPGRGSVYVFSGPYTDRAKLLRLVEELRELNEDTPLHLKEPLIFKTDLHNTWCEALSRPGDGYHELLKRNWLYRYKDGKLVIRAAILALHQALENPPEDADPEFLLIRSLLPDNMFAGSGSPDK